MSQVTIDRGPGTILRHTEGRVDNLEARNNRIPPGTQMVYAGRIDGNTDPSFPPPVGWFKCDGTAVSRVENAELFKAIGVSYGIGDSINTFNLPISEPSFFPNYFSSVYLLDGATLATGTDLLLDFDGEASDVYNMHENSLNPSRITVPMVGNYNCGAWVMAATGDTGFRQATLMRNSGSNPAFAIDQEAKITTSNNISHLNLNATVPLLAGDYITCLVDNLVSSSGTYYAAMWVHIQKPDVTKSSVIIKR